MKALTWHGQRDVRVDNVDDPAIQEPTDAIIRVTSSGICGSDLHLYEVMSPFLEEGDILGHEPMGVVEEAGSGASNLSPGDRVVIPFQISCGSCFMCDQGLQTQCETTQVRDQGMGAQLFGYTKLYGQVAGGQAEYLRVPQAQYTHIKVPEGPPDERFLYLSDVVPTAWQSVAYADTPRGGTLAIWGLGPIGQMAARIARQIGVERVIAIDGVPERLEMARRHDIETLDYNEHDDIPGVLREMTNGRGPDSVIDAVGMEAHGEPVGEMDAGADRLGALEEAIQAVRRGGTLSIIGVYGGTATPLPILTLFDKQIQVRMGQANVKHWIDDIMPLVTDEADPLGVEDLATHKMPLEQAPRGYDIFQKKQDNSIKVVLQP